MQDDNEHTCDHPVNASIKIIKYLKNPHGGWTSPYILPWIPFGNSKDSNPNFASDGLIISLIWEQATQENLLDWRIFWFFNECHISFQ